MITHGQLRRLGFSRDAIAHRVAIGRLHQVYRGVYAVGRPELTRLGQWMAAVLACGPGALLSHFSAAALYGVVRDRPRPIEVCAPRLVRVRGIRSHHGRREARRFKGIPVTSPVETLLDLAALLDDLCTPERCAPRRTPRGGPGQSAWGASSTGSPSSSPTRSSSACCCRSHTAPAFPSRSRRDAWTATGSTSTGRS